MWDDDDKEDHDDKVQQRFRDVIKETSECRSQKALFEKLMELGFAYCDDDDEEEQALIQEEQQATAENDRQHRLLNYLQSTDLPSAPVWQDFIDERASLDCNFALIRRFFRQGDDQLKALLTFGLDANPCDLSTLDDWLFLQEFLPNLSEMITIYERACVATDDIICFEEIVGMFQGFFQEYDYDYHQALLSHPELSDDKKRSLQLMSDPSYPYGHWTTLQKH